MKLILLIALFFTSSAACSVSDTVYVCGSENTKKYHYTPNCRGLGNCQYRILKVSLEKAKSEGKTLCGWER